MSTWHMSCWQMSCRLDTCRVGTCRVDTWEEMWGWSEKSKDIWFLRFLINPFFRYRADIGFGGFRTVPMSPEWPTNTTGSINNISLNIFERWDTRGNKFPSNFLVGGASGTRYRLIWTEMQHRWGAWVGLDIHNVHLEHATRSPTIRSATFSFPGAKMQES